MLSGRSTKSTNATMKWKETGANGSREDIGDRTVEWKEMRDGIRAAPVSDTDVKQP